MVDRTAQEHLTAARFRRACNGFDIKNQRNITSLVSSLDNLAQELAKSEQARRNAGSDPTLSADLRKLWRDVARALLTFWDGDDSEGEEGIRHKNQQKNLTSLCVSLSKFTRNLVAGVQENQLRVFENEPDIRRLLHYYTSWSAMEDNDSIGAARVLTQALSNMVTSNETLLAKLWETYMNLPEDQVVLIRLLSSPDSRTLLTSLIFIINCIHGSRKRTKLLTRTTIGARICVALLDDMTRLYDAEEGTEGAQAFDIGYAIFTQLIEEGLVPDLYKKFTVQDEIIAPHQTTLLKLVDSYLQSIQLDSTTVATPEIIKIHTSLSPFLARSFFALSTYAQNSINRAIAPSGDVRTSNTPRSSAEKDTSVAPVSPTRAEAEQTDLNESSTQVAELDVMLPKVCEALVLLTQCITTIALDAEQQKSHQEQNAVGTRNMKDYFNEVRGSDQGLVESLVELLRLLDIFLPRINFGKPVDVNKPSIAGTPTPTQQLPTTSDTGFSYLKRDLVRLLGVLSHGEQAVQNRTREAGGITVVMNLCTVDERNPFLREHAIFTLRNLLKGNPENQKIVDSIRPSAEWDEAGVLRDKPGAVRK